MRLTPVVAVLAIVAIGCHSDRGTPEAPRQNDGRAKFHAMRDAIVRQMLDGAPAYGRALGLHERYDGVVDDKARSSVAKRVAQSKSALAER